MSIRRAAVGGLAAIGLLSACGGSSQQVPDVAHLPLVPGSRVVVQTRTCDPGANAYCAVDLVLYNRRFRNSDDLRKAQWRYLRAHGWTGANGDTGTETAADSPGHKLHLTYATADGELQGWDQNWIKRPSPIVHALSRSIFDGVPALSMMVELDSGTS